MHLHLGVFLAVQWVADEHAEPGLERSNLSWLRRDIIDENTSVNFSAEIVVELAPSLKSAVMNTQDRTRTYAAPSCLTRL